MARVPHQDDRRDHLADARGDAGARRVHAEPIGPTAEGVVDDLRALFFVVSSRVSVSFHSIIHT